MSQSFKHQQWRESPQAERFFELEKPFSDQAMRRLAGPNVLLLGNLLQRDHLLNLGLPQLVQVTDQFFAQQDDSSLAADAAFLPFQDDSFASVLLPHVLEGHALPHQVLREAYRVLQAEGHLLLTCFNPLSLCGMQKMLRSGSVPQGQYYTFARVKDWLQLLGFEVVGSAMYHYAPISKSALLGSKLEFLNSVGDRWFPMLGGSYVITARKREAASRLIGKVSQRRRNRRRKLAAAPASHAKSKKQS